MIFFFGNRCEKGCLNHRKTPSIILISDLIVFGFYWFLRYSIVCVFKLSASL